VTDFSSPFLTKSPCIYFECPRCSLLFTKNSPWINMKAQGLSYLAIARWQANAGGSSHSDAKGGRAKQLTKEAYYVLSNTGQSYSQATSLTLLLLHVQVSVPPTSKKSYYHTMDRIRFATKIPAM
jgi:hypothetical protein